MDFIEAQGEGEDLRLMVLAHFTAVLANQHRRKNPLKGEMLYTPRFIKTKQQPEIPEAKSKQERNRVISLEAKRKERLRHIEQIGPQAIPVNRARLRPKSGRTSKKD